MDLLVFGVHQHCAAMSAAIINVVSLGIVLCNDAGNSSLISAEFELLYAASLSLNLVVPAYITESDLLSSHQDILLGVVHLSRPFISATEPGY